MPLGAARAVLISIRAPAYTANPVLGTNAYLEHNSALTGLADGKAVTISMWLRPTGTGNRRPFTLADATGASSRLWCNVLSTNVLQIRGRNAAAGDILQVDIGTIGDTDWHHYMISFDLANVSLRSAWIDGAAASPTWTTYTNDTLDLNPASPRNRIFGGANTTPDERYVGDIADLWLNDAYLDLTSSANRNKFYLNGRPVDLGADGSAPTGSSPVLFFSGATDSWHVNKGTGGGFTEVGTLADGTGPVEA